MRALTKFNVIYVRICKFTSGKIKKQMYKRYVQSGNKIIGEIKLK